MGVINLDDPVSKIKSVGERWKAKLKNLGIETVRDLLFHFPTRYEDFSEIYKIADLIPRQEATIKGTIDEINTRRSWKKNIYITEALISDDSGSIRAIWFNQPYVKNVLQPGVTANFSGKTSGSAEIYLSNPTYEIVRSDDAVPKHTARIVPVYPETKGLTSKGIRNMVSTALSDLKMPDEPLPREMLSEENLPGLREALRNVHFPENLDDAAAARRRFAFEDLFLLQLYNLRQKIILAKSESIDVKIDLDYVKSLIGKLPFELTLSQKKSLWEILTDTSKKIPMNRLLQGDVGSGKTVIAAVAALNAAKAGRQVAFMAPTSILASQHYNTFIKLFGDFESGVLLLTSGESEIFYGHGLSSEIKKKQAADEIKRDKVKIIIGTHALLQKYVEFPNLALVVVDEQHRFGVKQRAELLSGRESSLIPHFLSMSATPIPRTLSLTLFGDLDLSLITEMPKNRKKIITKAVSPAERKKAYEFIRSEVREGRQAFVIYPRIDPAEESAVSGNYKTALLWQVNPVPQAHRHSIEKYVSQNSSNAHPPLSRDFLWYGVKAVKEEYEKLSKKIFPDLAVAMLHGKMKSADKEEIMSNFLNKKIDVLISTSVIEVGVDIPNATIMMIEDADRFGLAQLYQFRGRVGRGEHQSYCFLFTESETRNVNQRLKAIVEAKNGFELAEKDLKLRGPGEFLGESQTGMPDLAMKAIQNPDLVKRTRELALQTLKGDPNLKKYPALKERLSVFEKEIHWE